MFNSVEILIARGRSLVPAWRSFLRNCGAEGLLPIALRNSQIFLEDHKGLSDKGRPILRVCRPGCTDASRKIVHPLEPSKSLRIAPDLRFERSK